jgi:hypothetical protein
MSLYVEQNRRIKMCGRRHGTAARRVGEMDRQGSRTTASGYSPCLARPSFSTRASGSTEPLLAVSASVERLEVEPFFPFHGPTPLGVRDRGYNIVADHRARVDTDPVDRRLRSGNKLQRPQGGPDGN